MQDFAIPQKTEWKLNTGNTGKLHEFGRLFSKYGCILSSTQIEVNEIDADPLSVIAHKASQIGEEVIVEDTSLDIEGAAVGIKIRWLLQHLSDFIGRKAVWTVLLAFRKGKKVYVFKGEVKGAIVASKGDGGFGFDPYFQPLEASETLAVSKPDAVNARAAAVEAFMKGSPHAVVDAITDWQGPWQSPG